MTPMPLSAALQKHFPDGGVTLSTMQNAIRQGKLNCSRLGRVYMVTAEDIQDWMKSCRVEKKQGSISASEDEAFCDNLASAIRHGALGYFGADGNKPQDN